MKEIEYPGLVDTLNINVEAKSAELTICTMPIKAKHLAPHGGLHGGASCVLIETTASIAATADSQPNQTVYAVSLGVQYYRSVSDGIIECQASQVSRSNQLISYYCSVTQGDILIADGNVRLIYK